jgi:glycine/D-amino acid oxidase-like deaminating enzyme
MPVAERFDAVVIGGGFYGLRIALHLREVLDVQRVVVIEAEPEAMSRASFANQARVHNGYHYPRSILTGYRSNVNLPRFRAEYGEAVVAGFQHHYAIARTLSRTNARQFELFCHRIGSAVRPASDEVRRRFDPQRIERVFLVEEPAFDSRVLRDLLLSRIERVGGIEVRAGARADRIAQVAGGVEVAVGEASLVAPRVISAVYAGINTLHAASGLPLVDVQQELTEMPLVAVPEPMRDTAVTVMDGPFFSIMPFPSRGLHTLSHVRFTPHHRWREVRGDAATDPYPATRSITTRSHFRAMYADVLRYMPAAAGMRHRDSLYEAKTVLARSSDDDSRPILYRRDHGIPGYTCVLGGKLDNIYDVLTELTNDER